MPGVGFFCPDGISIPFEECFKHCRLGQRCLSLPTLLELAHQREWTGIPSVTQLIKGTRQAFLEITRPYFFDPKSRAFSLLGTMVHSRLQVVPDKVLPLSEMELSLSLCNGLKMQMTGIPDIYDAVEKTLYDYKTSGSFAVVKAMNGEKKEWVLQLNGYRLMVEQLGYEVERLVIQAIARDGNTWIAKKRGIDEAIIMVEMLRMNDDEVLAYFRKKAKALHEALETGFCERCSEEETWQGRRCQKYCDVAVWCEEIDRREVQNV